MLRTEPVAEIDERRRVTMIARLLVSFGAVAASVGLTIFGMATSYIEMDDGIATWSYVLMAGGAIATAIGAFWYRADERKAEAAIQSRTSSRQAGAR